jgi:glycosyltransferase involved in cell wall biosynthesis
VLDAVDCLSLLWDRRSRDGSGPGSWAARLEASRLRRYEAASLPRFSAVLASSAAEAASLTRIAGGVPVAVVTNGVDAAYYDPAAWAPAAPSILFWGIMRYGPNVEAAARLCTEILPLVRARHPLAEVLVAGSSPTRRVRSLARLPGVSVLGYVPDLRPLLAAAAVAVFPIRAAAGIQNKALEAMAAGLPAVVSCAVADAIGATAGRELLVGDSSAELAEHTCAILGRHRALDGMRRAARALVEARFDWGEAADRLVAVYETALRAPAPGLPEGGSRSLAGPA